MYKIYRFQLKVYPPSFLSAGCVADWRAVFGNSSCCKEKWNQIIIREEDKSLSFRIARNVYPPQEGLPAVCLEGFLSSKSQA